MPSDTKALIDFRDKFLGYLIVAGRMRDQRPDLVAAPGGGYECAWVPFERDLMRGLVNQERESRGLRPVLESDVLRADQLAAGHVDWAQKFALYCAELALKEDSDG